MIAWIVGASEDQRDDEFVQVNEAESRRILTIAKDMIYLASNGKKVMPKHIALGMTVMHVSESAQLVRLLNGFGYSVFHSFVLEHDTALTQQEVKSGSIALPSCIQTGIRTTLMWGNNDFGEETLLGKGTTHNTNDIAVQHAQCQLPVTVAQAPSTVEAKKTKQRSLVAPDEDIIMFVGEKKSSPEAFSADIELELGPHLKTVQHHKDKDTAYYLTKSAPDNLSTRNTTKSDNWLSSCRGCKSHRTQHSEYYLHRSVVIANQVELPSVAVVVDQAIYAKAQTIRWQTPVFLERIVLRLVHSILR